jgi:hypothetical protein
MKTKSLNQTGIAHLALVFVLLFAIAAGTILIQNRTNFNPRADDWAHEEEFRPEPEEEAQPEPQSEEPERVEAPEPQKDEVAPDPPSENPPPLTNEETLPEENADNNPPEQGAPGILSPILDAAQELAEDASDAVGDLTDRLGITNPEND